jgi:hypothetical protein
VIDFFQDQKILSCIMAKEEDEKERAQLRESALNVWEEERKKELHQRQKEEAQRRRVLLEKTGERQRKLVGINNLFFTASGMFSF